MILYFCRHGIAVQGEGLADEDRPLTEDGAVKLKRAAKGFARLGPGVTHILTSPLVRARESAEILQEALGKAQGRVPKLAVCAALGSPAKLEATLTEVRGIMRTTPSANVLLVGHEPALSAWLGKLCFGREGTVELKKGAVAAVELGTDLKGGRLLWLVQPGLLREL